ncbi:MAG: non-homologous end-joining DNA ligase, partial [Myxococcota bacterium]
PRLVDTLLPALRASQRPTPAFRFADPLARGAVFVEPTLVAEVRYNEATERGLLRQPVFLRIRDDKTVLESDAGPRGRRSFRVSRSALGVEDSASAPREAAAPSSTVPSERTTQNAERTTSPSPPPRFKPTNTAKVFWPGEGYTKGDLLTYYERAWPWLEPYLRDRPLVLTRYPDGIAGKSFFQKNAPDFLPDWVPTVRVDEAELFVCNQLEALLYLVNLGSIPLHMWSARAASIEHPDWSILDLDPKDAPFRDVLAVARHIHALLAPLGAPHCIKTSGQAGLHVLIPLDGQLTHEEATAFAEVLARLVVADLPDIATIVRPLGGRAGKVYVDYLQNGRGKTIAAPFAVRPQPGAPVSTPLAWSEVTARLDPARFTIATVPKRLQTRGDPMLALFERSADVPAVLAGLRKR